MSWNNQGGGDRDPWSGPRDQGPPDLDEVVRKARERFSGMFGGKGPGSGGGGSTGGPGALGIGILVGILVVIWLASGIYIVDEGWRGVVTRFGKQVDTTMPGPHWHLPYPIESVEKVNTEERRSINIGFDQVGGSTRYNPDEALMLTEDENIVSVQLTVQYEVGDPASYLFNFVDPRQTLKEVTESALREVIGKRSLDDILATDDLLDPDAAPGAGADSGDEPAPAVTASADIALATEQLINDIIARYDLGIQLSVVNIQRIQPPEPVQAAFLDAIAAREDRERLINEAQAYRNSVVPRARGEAARVKEEAQGYKESVIADAQGDASRFEQVQREYAQAPEITRERLYLESMESVLSQSGKILVDLEANQPLMYLPLERMMRRPQSSRDNAGQGQQSGASSGDGSTSSAGSGESQFSSTFSGRRDRTRESR